LASILAMPGIEELVWVGGFFLVVLVKKMGLMTSLR
jgi:hypothetical protein